MLFNLCNLETVLQRNLRTSTARECIFRVSGGTRLKNFCQPWSRKGGGELQDVTGLPKKTLDTSLVLFSRLLEGLIGAGPQLLIEIQVEKSK